MKKRILAVAVLSSLLCCGTVWAEPSPDASVLSKLGAPDAGADLNRMREQMDRAEAWQQIEEGKEKAKNKVEDKSASQDKQQEAPAVTFKLQKITTDPSTVLTDAEINAITKDYLGKDVAVKDLYDIVGKINKLYEQKGYLTCKAFLPPQTIKEGTVKITLIEGKTGATEVTNNKYTKAKYITNRLHLEPGKVADINQLNNDLLRFNATNDAQLRIVMKAGSKPGTTDYEIQTYEPQQYNFSVFADNAGNYTSGEFREGLFYTVKSLSGNRDTFSIGTVFSEGMKALSSSYSRVVGRSGTKVNVSYSANSVDQVRNDSELWSRGHATSYNAAIIQPWIVTAKTRSEVSFELGHQNSKSDVTYTSNGLRFNVVDDTTNDATLAFAMTNYGKSHVFYQKHSYVRGHSMTSPTGFDETSDNYDFYKFDGLYQKSYEHGQLISARLSGQWAGNDTLRSSRQFYIGGMYSVRGYKENFLGGDSGLNFSAEYSVPITKDRKTSAFVFYDFGKLYQESAQSTYDKYILSSVGIGVRSSITKHIFASLMLGCPLLKSFDAEEVSPTRIHFIVSGQF